MKKVKIEKDHGMRKSNDIICCFIISAISTQQFPIHNLSEVAFIGRSNVGKSSLINALIRSEVCRVSKTPGRTQQINFFDVQLSKNHLIIADLPGYGYAVVSKKMRNDWNNLIADYLQNRHNLKRIFLLIDSRHGIKENDEEIMSFLDQIGVSYQLVFTKTDKIKSQKEKLEYEKILTSTNEYIQKHSAAYPVLIATSVQRASGLNELFNAISEI